MLKKSLLTCISVFLISSTAFAFSDSNGHTNEEAINYLQENNIVQGYSDGTYRPDNEINRAEFLKIILESLSINTNDAGFCFPDVKSDWYAPYVCKAKNMNIVSGYPDGNFKPANSINLAEALKIILEAYGADTTGDSSTWYAPYLSFMEDHDLLTRISADISESITRGEMAQLIYNLDKYNVKTTYSQGLCYDAKCAGEDPDYVIITRPLFLEEIQNFIEWKTNQGFKVGVLTVDYIDSIRTKSNPTENVREIIKDYSTSHSTDYFLLIGDTTVGKQESPESMYDLELKWNVPSGNLCNTYDDKEGQKCADDWQATDLYFADFDNEPWKKIDGGYYGGNQTVNGIEFSDFPSLEFETIVGRIPIREPEEFENIFYKMKNYPSVKAFDFYGSIFKKISYCDIGDFSSYDEAALYGLEDCRNSPGIIKDLMESNGIDFNYDFFDVFDELLGKYNELEVEAGKKLLLSEENLVLPHYHGGVSSIESLDTDDVQNFKHIFSAWIVESCNISFFADGDSESLSESLLKAPKGPAFVLRLPNTYAFLKGSMEGMTVGEAFYNINEPILMVRSGNNILFGDPSLKLFD